MRIAIALLVLALGACAQRDNSPSLADIHAECRVGGRPFVDTWNCERVGVTAMSGYEDIKGVYIATGNFVAEQVTAGKMTDAEAKLAMATARQKAVADSDSRYQQRQASRPPIPVLQTYQPTNTGLPPLGSQTAPISVSCSRLGPSNVICY